MCPSTVYDAELMDSLKLMIDTIDYEKHNTNGPIFTLCAYRAMLLKEKRYEQNS